MSLRALRKFMLLLGAGAIVFAQAAVAAHACTAALAGAASRPALASSPADLSMHSGHDPDGDSDAALCLQHCSMDQQSVDQQAPFFSGAAAAAVHFSHRSDLSRISSSVHSYSQALLARLTAPHLSVRNCCFRI